MCFFSFPPHPFFCSPFVLFHYCCCLRLCLAWLLQMTVLYNPLFLPCFLFCFVFLSVFLFGYAPYCVLTGSRKNHNVFLIPASPLSSAVLSHSVRFPVRCVTAVHPFCFFPTSVFLILSTLILALIFSKSFWICYLLLFKNFSQMFIPESTCF